MLAQSPLSLAHASCKKCLRYSSERFSFEHHWTLYFLLLGLESLHKCPHARNDSHFRETFLHHICLGHIPKTVPERCAKRVKNLTDWIVKTEAYPVAYGGFSDIWSCQLRAYPRMSDRRVAVKAIRPLFLNDEEFQVKRKAVDQELKVWVQLEHQNILPLYGIADGFGPFPSFVCPWADNGTLSEYLETFETTLDLKKRMELLRDIAAGVRYLHHNNIVHGDLSSTNVLIANSGKAFISDFGLSTLLDNTASGNSFFPGNIRWAAPELFGECKEASQLASPRADIYSFGSLMLEILTGKLPFHGIQRVAQIVIMVSKGTRPPREPAWDGGAIPDPLWEFMEACWSSPPTERPTSILVDRFIKGQLSRL